jgi:pSer/pThr/pTyr-binding forkhead associated (FHA) protein
MLRGSGTGTGWGRSFGSPVAGGCRVRGGGILVVRRRAAGRAGGSLRAAVGRARAGGRPDGRRSTMTPTILVRHLADSSLAGQSRAFRQPRVRLGRRRENDVVFDPTIDRTVSGHHCEIQADAGALFVVDDGSTNGTFVNGRRVQGRTPVTDQDRIMLGQGGPVVGVSATAGEPPAVAAPAAGSVVPEPWAEPPPGLLEPAGYMLPPLGPEEAPPPWAISSPATPPPTGLGDPVAARADDARLALQVPAAAAAAARRVAAPAAATDAWSSRRPPLPRRPFRPRCRRGSGRPAGPTPAVPDRPGREDVDRMNTLMASWTRRPGGSASGCSCWPSRSSACCWASAWGRRSTSRDRRPARRRPGRAPGRRRPPSRPPPPRRPGRSTGPPSSGRARARCTWSSSGGRARRTAGWGPRGRPPRGCWPATRTWPRRSRNWSRASR